MKFIFTLTLKAVDRSLWYLRGSWLKIKIISLGGKCSGIIRVGPNVYWKYPPHEGINISDGVEIGPGCYFDVPPDGKLMIGSNVKFTGGIYLSSLASVRIGSDSLIAEHCSIRDAEHITGLSLLINKQKSVCDSVSIGSDVWLCKGATVLRGSTIGDGAVIGAHSLVKNTVLDGQSIYVGAPVRFIKKRV
ncbi:acyltransferase [Pseudomonas corrugata]|uniref:acyltransferase n=1 Tax=Pseudomonas corrugata TaxID=47879 RepID=UPI002233E58E|nr:acyltransferase [Pseudomonas corrugata]UZE07936.1 acyltransferase [Pseudomonas corrugata]